MSRKHVLVLGGNFGGLTAGLAVRHELHGDVDVTVVSASDRFLFNPSLIWLPFGKRAASDITFPLAPTFETNGVEFVHAEATHLDLAAQAVDTTAGRYSYDYLVIATGYRNNFDVAPGLGPGGNAHTITPSTKRSGPGKAGSGSWTNRETSSWAPPRGRAASAPPTNTCSTSPTSYAGRA